MPYVTVAKDVQEMFGTIAPRYDITNSALSFGIHHLWRRSLLKLLPTQPQLRVLDLCTGTGDLLPLLKRCASEVLGGDFCRPMLNVAKRKNSQTPLIQSDALSLPFQDESFDMITVAFGVRNFENLNIGLKEARRVLRKDGSLIILEFGQPQGIWGALFKFYSKNLMPAIGGTLTGNRDAYEYLPKTARTFPCGEKLCTILENCEFKVKKAKALTGGIAYLYHATKK